MVAVASACAAALAGCVTKPLNREAPLSIADGHVMTCEDITTERVRLDAFDAAVADSRHMDVRNAVSVVTDFGFGNRIERHRAMQSSAFRRSQLRELWFEKGCEAQQGQQAQQGQRTAAN